MIILASASPRRRELMAQAGLTFEVRAAEIDETPQTDEAAAAYVERLAIEKAQAIAERAAADAIVVAADTAVVVDGPNGSQILGKPVDNADAERMLGLLAGRTHAVMTGVAVVAKGVTRSSVEVTQVWMDLIPADELTAYVVSGEPKDKAGAYAIQGYAARWIPRIEGCYFNVVGLPIARVVGLLAEAGVVGR